MMPTLPSPSDPFPSDPFPSDHAAQQKERASVIIKEYVLLALAISLVPAPLWDEVGVAGLELSMISDLAHAYDFPMPGRLATYKLLISLIGSIGPVYFAGHLQSSFKVVPVIGYLLSAGMLSMTNAASVYAVGKIFQKHFESGGTFLSSDNSVIRRFFKESRTEGRKLIPQYAR